MAKGGPLKFLLPAALGIGALATGGFGLPALLGGEGAAAAGAGEAAAGTAATVGEATPELTAGLLAAPETVGPLSAGVSEVAPLSAGAAETAAEAAPSGVSGLGPLAAGFTNVADFGSAGASALEAAAPSVNLGETIPSSFLPGVQAATATLAPVGAAPTLGAGGLLGDPSAYVAADPASQVAADVAAEPIAGDSASLGEDFSSDSAGSTFGDIFKDVGGLRGLTSLFSAGLLGSQLFKGVQQYPEQRTLGQQAAGYQQTGQALTQPLFTGALPTGAQSAVDASAAASKARTRSTFANLGLTGSTMEAQALQSVDQNKAAQTFGIADQLLGQALPYSQLGTRTTEDLLRTAMQEDADYRAALANFSRALAGTGTALPTA